MAKKYQGRGVVLSERLEQMFHDFGDEFIRHWDEENPGQNDIVEVCWPVVTVASCQMKCFATGARIKSGDECVVIFGKSEAGRSVRLAAFENEATLAEMIEYGRVDLPPSLSEPKSPKPQSILPHMNVCYCIQCGGRVVRPEEMAIAEFGALRRCDKCLTNRKPMKLGVERFCRTCGVKFLPKGKSGHSEATCPKHGRHAP